MLNILILLPLYPRASLQYQYELAVCAIFQNEERFLKEWIEFHKLVGVQHFFLYNNKSTDQYMEILKPYIERSEIDLYDWNFDNKSLNAQIAAYNDSMRRNTGKVKWIAFLDLDEYLYPVRIDNLITFLRDYEKCAELSVNWVMFGTSDVEKIPENGLMLEHLTKCDPIGNKHVKSIVRPERILNFINNNPHFAQCRHKFKQVNPDNIHFHGPYSPYISLDKIRINHYWTRDKEWLTKVKIPRAIALNTNRMVNDNTAWYLNRHDSWNMTPEEWVMAVSKRINISEDKTIQKYLLALQAIMCNQNKLQ